MKKNIVITDGGNSVLMATVKEIKAAEALVIIPNDDEAWLPAYELYADFKYHEDLRSRKELSLGSALPVVEPLKIKL